MNKNNNYQIKIEPGELLKLAVLIYELELRKHEIWQVINIIINSIFPNGRVAVIDFDTGEISLLRNKNNLSKIDKIPANYLKFYETFLIDFIFKNILADKKIDYIVFINRDIFYKRLGLDDDNFESFKKRLANTEYCYIDLLLLKKTKKQIDLNYSKTLNLDAQLINKKDLSNDQKSEKYVNFYLGSYILFCTGKYYINSNFITSLCITSLINNPHIKEIIQYKKSELKSTDEKIIRRKYHSSKNNAKAIGLNDEDADSFALNEITLNAFS